ncbi:MAG TPA: RNA methyltransferase [Candidatus Sulfomarinibacteraceae bacterium]|nr:RNA methyltransferase [Candidatus Sulfomarinibacteraceae bacterium]
MDRERTQQAIDYLAQFVTAQRQRRIEEALRWRTRHLTVMLEDVYQPHNASAVLRTCEIFGVQDVHIVERANKFRPNRDIALGAPQWLTLHRYRDDEARRGAEGSGTRRGFRALRRKGYHIAALTLEEDSAPLASLSLEQPLALCFGTEEEGLSAEAHDLADSLVHLPMYGFTQSFNISVTVALALQTLIRQLHNSDVDWRLSQEAQLELKLEWLVQTVPRGDIVLKNYLAQQET